MAARMPKGAVVSRELEPHERLAQAYRNTFTSEDGKLVLDDIRKSHNRRSSFVPGAPDQTAFNEGQRSWYIRIMQYLDPEMIDEEETL